MAALNLSSPDLFDEAQGSQPGAHTSAADLHGPSLPPHLLPVGGARRSIAPSHVAKHPRTVGLLQKASHSPSAQPSA